MQRAIFAHLLTIALVTGNLASVTAVYDCVMSGQRNLKTCCCSAADQCPDETTSALDSAAGVAAHELRRLCCKVSFEEKAATGPSVRCAGDTSWKEMLDHGRVLASLLVGISLDRFEPDLGSLATPPRGRSPRPDCGPPIFIANCALLI